LLCEVCGRKIRGQASKVIIERAKLVVCNNCAKHGTGSWVEPKSGPKISSTSNRSASTTGSKNKNKIDTDDYLEPVEKFHIKVKQARIAQKLSYEELGRKLNVKVSMLKKIEKGKIVPENRLLRKIEHVLHVKLLDSNSKKQPYALNAGPMVTETTLGDLVKIQRSEEKA